MSVKFPILTLLLKYRLLLGSNFLNKVVESQNFDFKSQEIKAKVFFLGNLLDYAKSSGTPKESKDVEMDSDILVSSSQAEITIQ